MKIHIKYGIAASLFWCLSLLAPSSLHAAEPKGQKDDAVCGWFVKNEWKLFLCGPKSTVQEMKIEAKVDHHVKPTSPVNKSIPENKSILVKQIAVTQPKAKTKPELSAPIITSSIPPQTELSNSIEKELQIRPVATSSPTNKKGFLVATIGDSAEAIEKLRKHAEKDYQLLKRSPYENRVSLGVFSQYQNAYSRQNKLLSLGISAEIIDRSQNLVVRTKAHQKTIKPDIKQNTAKLPKTPKTTPASKPQKPTSRGYLVASINDTVATVSKLEALKDKDFLILKSAPYKDRVSLGVYNKLEYAIRRQSTLLALGLETELINRSEGRVESIAAL